MEDIRERIAKIEFVRDDFTFAEGGRFNFTKAGIIKLLTYLKANGIVKLAENQELPKCDTEYNPMACGAEDDTDNCYRGGWDEAQQAMADFKRVEELI